MQQEVSTARLYVMRALYALIALYLGSTMWPLLFNHKPWPDLMHGVAVCLMAALGVLMAWGIRYPLQMLPALLFELFWKLMWLGAVGLPLRAGGQLDPDSAETFKACAVGVVLCVIAIPWGYVWANYIVKPGERWRRAAA